MHWKIEGENPRSGIEKQGALSNGGGNLGSGPRSKAHSQMEGENPGSDPEKQGALSNGGREPWIWP